MRVARRLLQATLLVLTLVIGAAAASLTVSQTAWFRNWLRGYIVGQADQYLNGQLTIGRLDGNLFFGIELHDVSVTMDGEEVVSVQDLGIVYSLFDLLSQGLTIDDVQLKKPVLHLRREGETWTIARLIKRQRAEADRQGPASPFAVNRIGISDGSIVVDGQAGPSTVDVPDRFDRLEAQLSFKYEPVHYSIEIARLSFRGSHPEIGVNALSGGIALRDDTLWVERLALRTEETSLSIDGSVRHYLTAPSLELRLSSDKVSLPEIARVVPMLAGITLEPQFEVEVAGPLDGLAVEMNLRSSAGQMTGRFVTDLMTPDQSIKGDLAVRHLDLAPLVKDPQLRTDLTADLSVDLHASAFGDLDSLRGRVSLTSPRVAAMGYAAERVKANATVQGTRIRLDARAEAYGGNITAAGPVSLPISGAPLVYDLQGLARGADLRRLPPALKVPPVETAINTGYHVRGTEGDVRRLDLDLRFDQTRVAGAAVVAGSTAGVSLRGDDLTFTADAAIAEIDLQQIGHEFDVPALESDRYEGRLGGRVVTEGSIAGLSGGVTLDNIQATARVDLDPSSIGVLVIDRATLDADYRDRTGDIRRLDIVARDLNVEASGIVALDDVGQSRLTFRADTPHLEEIGKLANLDIAGIARVDGTLTGNRSELRAIGHLVGNGINYGETGALSLATDYDARVPDLDIDRVSVSADTNATFVTIAGQQINELVAKTIYADRQLQFDATAKQPNRSLAAGGSAAFHTDHQEVHLEQLTLETEGMSWQLAPGSEATVQYGNNSVAVKDLRLVSGDQQMTADGTFGRPGEGLRFTMENVDLASVDALLLRPPQFLGRLDASGTVTGSAAAPHVDGQFQVREGAFRDFKYESFGGTLIYAGPTLSLDTRLQQNPAQWMTVKGTVPVSFFSAPSPDGATASDSMDLAIDSSPIDLGLIQGFTTAVTNITGLLEAHVRVTGTADDPRPDGTVTVTDGALNVGPTGVSYKNIAGQIQLQPDRVHIDQITVLDSRNSALSVTGDLAIRERQLGGVQLYVTASDFQVIDNKMGDVRIESSLEVTGELRAPRVGGYFGVSTGRVNLDEILALTGPSAYSTEQTEFLSDQPSDLEPAPSVFDALEMDVSLYVPNDLIIRSSSLQTPGSPIGLGALNVTLGGDLRAVKDSLDRLRLYGDIKTVRGSYDFQGRRFEILRDGSIRFDGTDELDPRLDIRTRRLIQAVEAFVTIRGTLKRPEIVLTSTPPLDQGDVLALVVFNRPLSELGEGEQISLAARAQALTAGAVVNQLARSIGGALRLDTFEIAIAPDANTDALVTIGQQIGQNLYVKVQHGVGSESLTNVILEYELTRWLRLQTNVVESSATQQNVFGRVQDSGADLIFFFSF